MSLTRMTIAGRRAKAFQLALMTICALTLAGCYTAQQEVVVGGVASDVRELDGGRQLVDFRLRKGREGVVHVAPYAAPFHIPEGAAM